MDLNKELEKSFPKIEKLFTRTMLLEFANTPVDDLEQYNFGLGTMIRLKLLRPKSALYRKLTQNSFTNKEEMSMKIIKEYYMHLHRNI